MSKPRRSVPRQARGAMLWGLGFFVALQAGLALAMLTRVPHWRDPVYGAKIQRLQKRLASAGDDRVLVVMLGSSRTAWGFRGELVERTLTRRLGRPAVVFNFGQLGAGPIANLLTLKRLLADVGRPDLVLIEVLPLRLAGQVPQNELTDGTVRTHWLRGEELSLVRHYTPCQRTLLGPAWWRARAVPWFAHRIEILSSVFPSLLYYTHQRNHYRSMDDSGWAPRPTPDTSPMGRKRMIHQAWIASHPLLDGYRLSPLGVEALEEILETCSAEGVPVALCFMPEGPTFRSWYPPGAAEEVEACVAGLAQRFGVSVVNAREWITARAFADDHHLLPAGATLFSERLGQEVIVPLLCDEKAMPEYQGQQ